MTFEEFMLEVEKEAKAEGADAETELEGWRDHFRNLRNITFDRRPV